LATDDAFHPTLRIMRVLVSGRKDKRLDQMLALLHKANVQVLTVVTKVDRNFRERCDQEVPKDIPKEGKAELRRKIAEGIIKEDKEASGGDDPIYACVLGWGAPEDEVDEEEDIPPKPVRDDFAKYFRVHTRAELRRKIEVFMGLDVAAVPAAAPAVVDVA